MADGAAMRALVASGEVRPTDEVATPDGWIRVDQHPLLRAPARGADPWAAWSDVDSVDAASLYRKMVDAPADEVTELPSDALTPMFEVNRGEVNRGEVTRGEVNGAEVPPVQAPPVQAPRPPPVVDRAPVSLEPVRAARPAAHPLLEPLPEDGAEVIDFPRQRAPTREFVLPPTARRATAPPPLVRTTRLVVMVLVGLLMVMVGYAWIRMNAYTGVGAGTLAARTAPTRPPAATAAPISPLVELDAQLRADLTPHPRDVKEPGDLSDALMIELMRQRLDVIDASGLVTKWIGKKGDEPKTAEVRITYRSGGDMSRELGAIALVVGRYKRFYRMDMPVFEVVEAGARG
ncbi:MAG: hypothetical protein Q7U06_00070, partial [Pseudomonadota bacterium]|nr:hypothetical protein [Pseudomonadota bacterium]